MYLPRLADFGKDTNCCQPHEQTRVRKSFALNYLQHDGAGPWIHRRRSGQYLAADVPKSSTSGQYMMNDTGMRIYNWSQSRPNDDGISDATLTPFPDLDAWHLGRFAGSYIEYPYWGNDGHREIGSLYTTLLHVAGEKREYFGVHDPMLKGNASGNGPLGALLV